MISWKSRPEIPPDDLRGKIRGHRNSLGSVISSRRVMTDTTPGEEQMK